MFIFGIIFIPTKVNAGTYTLNNVEYQYGLTNQKAKISKITPLSTDLTEIIIPNKIYSYEVETLYDNCLSSDSIIQITIPDSVITMEAAFRECSNLQNVYVDENNNKYSSINGIVYSKDKTELVLYPAGRTEIVYSFEDNSNIELIGRYAFYKCTQLQEIKIPASVITINYNAFAYNTALKKVTFEDNSKLETIYGAFINCTALTNIEIPASVIKIDETFQNCTSLTNVTFKENSKLEIINRAFINCTALTNIEIPASVKTINAPFGNCTSLTNITFENNSKLKTLKNTIFTDYSNLETLIFEDNSELETIDKNTFKNFTELIRIDFGENSSLKTIGEYAFEGCTSLEEITIPSSVTELGRNAFNNCISLVNVNFEENSQLNTIGMYAFSACALLEKIKILSTVTTIGGYAFQNCTSLAEVTFEEESILKSIQSYAFYGCSELTEIEIPETVTGIGDYAFDNCISLTNIIFKKNSQLERIGRYTFNRCKSLEEIEIPVLVSQIQVGTFQGCTSLKTIIFDENSQLNKIETYAFNNCTSLQEITIPSSVTSIGSDAFNNCTSLKSVIFDENSVLTSLGQNAFLGCSLLEKITIPSSLTTIDGYAFQNCISLKEVTFEKNSQLTVIGGTGYFTYGRVFENCTSLQEITIPSSVISIERYTFQNCTSLKKVIFEENSQLKGIDIYVFSGCSLLEEITIPLSVTSIGSSAFANCISLEEITIPSSVTSIGSSAFENCTALIKIEIPENVESISYNAFNGRNENLVMACKENSIAYNYAKNNNIEVLKFEGKVTYSNNEVTCEPVAVIINLNYKLSAETISTLEKENWIYNIDELKLEKTYENNNEEKIELIDKLGNSINIYIKISNIDHIKPVINISYEPTDYTSGKVDVLIMADEAISTEVAIIENGEIVRTEEWPYITEIMPSMLTNTFDENIEMDIRVKDLVGNYSDTTKISINNIKTNISEPEVKYIPSKEAGITNKNVIAEIDFSNTSEEKIEFVNNSEELTIDGLKAQYEFKENGTYTFYYKDSSNNQGTVTVNVDWIDKISPRIAGVENAKTYIREVEINVTDENLKEVTILKNNKENISYKDGIVLKDIGTYTIKATDIATNISEVTFEIIDKDTEAPTINKITKTPETWTNGTVEIEVEAEDGSGLAYAPFSTDGKAWTNENLQVTENGIYEIYVKDRVGKITTQTVEINNIDKTSPELKVEVANNDKVSKTKEVTITAQDTLSGLNEQNEFKYCVTDSKEPQGEEWLDYELNKTFEIGEKTGEYYLHVKGIADKAGNEAKVETTKITLDNTAPKVLVNDSEEETTHKTATIKVEEENVYEIVVMKDGEVIEYKENETIKEIGSYEIIVKDVAGNESKVKFEISEFITNEKYTTYEEEGKWYIGNISPETSKERFIENLETNIPGIEVKTKEQETLVEGKYVGTGMTVVMQGIEYKLIVKGDTTGDGKANGQDALAILFHREDKLLLEGEQLKAADLNEDGKINGMDALLLLLHRERQEGYIL